MKKTILIVNRNLAFVFRLGRTLEAAGHQVLPARGVQDAKALLSDLRSPIDLLLIHRGTAGADCLIEELRQTQGLIAVMDLCGYERQKPELQDVLTDPRRLPFSFPRLLSPVSTSERLGLVGRLLADTLAQMTELLVKKP